MAGPGPITGTDCPWCHGVGELSESERVKGPAARTTVCKGCAGVGQVDHDRAVQLRRTSPRLPKGWAL